MLAKAPSGKHDFQAMQEAFNRWEEQSGLDLTKNVSQAVCGASTGKPWTCTTWAYGEFPYDRASFTIAADRGSLVLRNFDVHRK